MIGETMDSRKIIAIVAVLAIVACAVVVVVMTQQQENKDLSVVYLKKNGYETEMVAEAKGFFSDEGVNVKGETVTGSGQDAVNKLLAGSVDIAATGQGPVANTLHEYADDLVIILWYFASGDHKRYAFEKYQQIFDKEIRPKMNATLGLDQPSNP